MSTAVLFDLLRKKDQIESEVSNDLSVACYEEVTSADITSESVRYTD